MGVSDQPCNLERGHNVPTILGLIYPLNVLFEIKTLRKDPTFLASQRNLHVVKGPRLPPHHVLKVITARAFIFTSLFSF